MIIGNFEKSRVYFKAVPPLFQSSHIRSLLIVKQSLLNFKLICFSSKELCFFFNSFILPLFDYGDII